MVVYHWSPMHSITQTTPLVSLEDVKGVQKGTGWGSKWTLNQHKCLQWLFHIRLELRGANGLVYTLSIMGQGRHFVTRPSQVQWNSRMGVCCCCCCCWGMGGDSWNKSSGLFALKCFSRVWCRLASPIWRVSLSSNTNCKTWSFLNTYFSSYCINKDESQ